MKPHEHYAEAERLLEESSSSHFASDREHALRQAEVHALLATAKDAYIENPVELQDVVSYVVTWDGETQTLLPHQVKKIVRQKS